MSIIDLAICGVLLWGYKAFSAARKRARVKKGVQALPVSDEMEPALRIIEHEPDVVDVVEQDSPIGEPTNNLGVVDVGRQRFQLIENRGEEGLFTQVRPIDRKGRAMGDESVEWGSLAHVARAMFP